MLYSNIFIVLLSIEKEKKGNAVFVFKSLLFTVLVSCRRLEYFFFIYDDFIVTETIINHKDIKWNFGVWEGGGGRGGLE